MQEGRRGMVKGIMGVSPVSLDPLAENAERSRGKQSETEEK